MKLMAIYHCIHRQDHLGPGFPMTKCVLHFGLCILANWSSVVGIDTVEMPWGKLKKILAKVL